MVGKSVGNVVGTLYVVGKSVGSVVGMLLVNQSVTWSVNQLVTSLCGPRLITLTRDPRVITHSVVAPKFGPRGKN